MFTQKKSISQIASIKYEKFGDIGGGSLPFTESHDAYDTKLKKEVEAKTIIDIGASIAKKNDIFKKENDDKAKTGFSYTEINDEVKKYMTMGYIPNEAPKNNPLNLRPTNLGSAVPVTSETATPVVEAPKTHEYEIKPGNTLSQIAKNHGLTLDQLVALNKGMDIKKIIKPGDKIQVTGEEKTVIVKQTPKVNPAGTQTDKTKENTSGTPTAGKIEKKTQVTQTIKTKENLDEELQSAISDMREAATILEAAHKSGDKGVIDEYNNKYLDQVAKANKIQSALDKLKAQENYDKLSLNGKNLEDYKEALKKVEAETQKLVKDSTKLYQNQDKINRLGEQKQEILYKIGLCNNLIKNDEKIKKLEDNNDSLKITLINNPASLTQYTNINNKDIKELKGKNSQLLALLENSSIAPTKLAQARKEIIPTQA